MLQILTKNRKNIFYFLDFSGNASEFLIICTKTSKYLNIYYKKKAKIFFYLALWAWRVNIFSMLAHHPPRICTQKKIVAYGSTTGISRF